MAKPAIFTVDYDPEGLRAAGCDLRRRYGREYRILWTDSGQSTLDVLGKLKTDKTDNTVDIIAGRDAL